MPQLTKLYVDKLKPQEKRYTIWDNRISGFGIRVAPSGRKTYIMKYRTIDGRQKKPSIGVHGNITCEQAKQIAKEWHGEIAAGRDPTENKMTLRQSPSIANLADRYFKEHVLVHNKRTTQDLTKIYLDKYIIPHLGALKVLSIQKEDVQRLHISMKDKPMQANRILGTLSKMMSLAEDWNLRPQHSNPVLGVQKYKEEKRERYLSNSELGRLVAYLDMCDTTGKESIYITSLFRLLLLTGARLSEIKNAKWEWIDFERAVLRLPDSKTGKKVVHLSPAAMAVLDNIPQADNNPYIIVGRVEGAHLDNAQKPWCRIRKEVEIQDVRIHDLRHTYASLCVGQGMSIQMVAKLLGHAQVRTSERYAHLADDPVQSAAAQIGDVIMGKSSLS